jgi:thiamine biosynthesis lipoprotein
MKDPIDRRRFLTISAAVAGLGLVPIGAPPKSAAAHLVEWRGIFLGTVATLRIHHTDPAAAQHLIQQAVGEARRLETVFSLYRSDSVLCELNRRGVLIGPPVELSELLTLCDHFWQLTDGMFDPTVQPLWRCYADHFAAANQTLEGPSKAKLSAALELVGWEKLRFNRNSIVFNRRGMGLTLNGIAQGYVTDRMVELLRAAGIESSLADMGEIRALGSTPQGRPWRVALEDPSGEVLAGRSIPIVNKAVATSGAVGFRFDEQGRCNHLFNPSTGACSDPLRSLTVIADTAATADALSTTFALMDEKRIGSVLSRCGAVEAYITTERGIRAIAAISG